MAEQNRVFEIFRVRYGISGDRAIGGVVHSAEFGYPHEYANRELGYSSSRPFSRSFARHDRETRFRMRARRSAD